MDVKKTMEELMTLGTSVLAGNNVSEVTVSADGISLTLKQQSTKPDNKKPPLPALVLLDKCIDDPGNEKLLKEVETRSREILEEMIENQPYQYILKEIHEQSVEILKDDWIKKDNKKYALWIKRVYRILDQERQEIEDQAGVAGI